MNQTNLAVNVIALSVKFGDFYAVNNLSFSVQSGEIFGFLGANGAGKTTTIRVLCGLLHPSLGEVFVGGLPFKTKADEMNIKRKVGYMSQKFTLYDDLTVEENFSFTASLRGLNKKNYRQRREFILNFISFDRPLKSFVKDLPGGIKQQVSLAAALLHDPEIIFLDEPTAGVTPAMRARFWSLIRDLAKLGKTVFITTHYLDEAEQCGRIALMKAGEMVALDTPESLKKLTFPEKMYELIPTGHLSYAKVQALKSHAYFDFFEPYGLRFHVVFKKTAELASLKKTLGLDFTINEISPTLEDVFIKTVEDKVK